MIRISQTVIVFIIAGAAYIAGRAGLGAEPAALGAKQEQNETDAPKSPAMTPKQQEMMSLGEPGEAHKPLELLLGDWEGEVELWFTPGKPPMTFKGSKKRESLFGKRFVMEHVDANSDMGPFHGLAIMGYNNLEKRYEAFWIDDGGTQMTTTVGTYDAATKTFIFTGDEVDMSGKKVTHRMTINCSNADKQIIEGFKPGRDGKEFKTYEGTFTRKK